MFLLKKGRTENAPDVVHVIRNTGRPRIVGVVLCRVNSAYLVRRIRFNEPIVNGMAQDGLDCRKCLVIDGLWGKCLWVWIFCLSAFKAFDDLEDRKILKFLRNTGRAFKKGVLEQADMSRLDALDRQIPVDFHEAAYSGPKVLRCLGGGLAFGKVAFPYFREKGIVFMCRVQGDANSNNITTTNDVGWNGV